MTAPAEIGEEKKDFITKTSATDVSTVDPDMQIFDLYTVRHEPERVVQPFIHRLNIGAEGGEVIRVWANFDDGALANVMSVTKFEAIKQIGRAHV